MAELSPVLFSLGVILVALGFAAHVGHAVMLANGRRALPDVAAAVGVSRQPAYAGVVTGSFVTSQARAASSGPALAAAGSPPVVVTSALTINPRRLAEFGCVGYLPKPYPLETLVATVRRHVQGET